MQQARKENPGAQPSPADQRHCESDTPTTRRGFLNRLWLLLAALGVVEFVVMLTAYFKPRNPRVNLSNTDGLVVAGKVVDFRPGSVTAYPQGRFYLVRLEDGGFLALSRQCTHLGCTVPWDEKAGQFACPCHASVFDITGSVIKSPAPRALDCFPITIENNVIQVDAGQRIRRRQFRDEQIIYAISDRN